MSIIKISIKDTAKAIQRKVYKINCPHNEKATRKLRSIESDLLENGLVKGIWKSVKDNPRLNRGFMECVKKHLEETNPDYVATVNSFRFTPVTKIIEDKIKAEFTDSIQPKDVERVITRIINQLTT